MAKRRSTVTENEQTEEKDGTEVTQTTDTPAETAAIPEQGGKKRERKVLAPMDLSALRVVVVTNADTMRDFKRSKGERHPEQVAVDGLVRKAYETWVAAGRPTTWTESRGLLLTIPADQMDTLRTRVQRAGAFYDFAIRFSDVKEKDGYAEVLLVVKDKAVKSENETDVDEDDEDLTDGDDGSEENGEESGGEGSEVTAEQSEQTDDADSMEYAAV